jgi:O-antigen ligase
MKQQAGDVVLATLFLFLPVAGLVSGPIYAPAVFGVAVLRLAWLAATQGGRLRMDRKLAIVAVLFMLLAWAGIAWSIAPGRTLAGAVQACLVLPAALAFLAGSRLFPAERAERLAGAMLLAFLAGMVVLLADHFDGYWLLRQIDGPNVWPTKYNRGIDYFALILLPTLGFFAARGEWRKAGLLAAVCILTIAAGRNTTAQIALPAVALTIGLAALAPRLVCVGLAALTTLVALALPFALRLITHARPLIAPHIKPSGLERLEIWDYLSAHVLQHPFLGWGLQTARLIPATPEEMAHYVKATGGGIYAHNQWLQLWLEMGFPGALLGLAFTLLVLRRAWHLPASLRPFAFGAYVMAMAVASSGFEITTDSWWAALAASAALFGLFQRALAAQAPSA